MMTERRRPAAAAATAAAKGKKTFSNDILYNTILLEMKVLLSANQIGTQITKENLRHTIAAFTEGKCIEEGYVQPNSVQLKTYSTGALKGDKIEFHVVFECKVYNAVEGSWIHKCKVKSVTKAGVHAQVFDSQSNVPATVFIIREHFANNDYFNTIQEGDLVDVKVIGRRFELNDSCVEVLGNLMPKEKE